MYTLKHLESSLGTNLSFMIVASMTLRLFYASV